MRLTLERFLLMEPETSPHRPGESNSEQRQQLIELVRVTEMSKFTRACHQLGQKVRDRGE
jgi:hypothetical protein